MPGRVWTTRIPCDWREQRKGLSVASKLDIKTEASGRAIDEFQVFDCPVLYVLVRGMICIPLNVRIWPSRQRSIAKQHANRK